MTRDFKLGTIRRPISSHNGKVFTPLWASQLTGDPHSMLLRTGRDVLDVYRESLHGGFESDTQDIFEIFESVKDPMKGNMFDDLTP